MNYNELYIYIKRLFNQYFNIKYSLSKEQKEDIIQDTILSIYERESMGTLSSKIEENKNYIFITLRNKIIREKTKKGTTEMLYVDNFENNELLYDFDIISHLTNETLLNQIKSISGEIVLTNKQQQIFNLTLNGLSKFEILENLELEHNTYYFNYRQVVNKIKEALTRKNYYKVFKIDKTSNVYFFKDKTDVCRKIKTTINYLDYLLSNNGYAVINGWKVIK